MRPDQGNVICLFLSGDVMTGRGIDQVLPHPVNPGLYEPWVRDARHYVKLAEHAHGPIQRPVDVAYIWGDALAVLRGTEIDVRIINLETSITCQDDAWPDKGIHYRMNPRNIGCLTAASIDCCCLVNNHVLDWGYKGLEETLQTLDVAGIRHAGAGRNAEEAASPAILEVADKGRVLVFSLGSPTSGIPRKWRAGKDRMGVNLLADLSEDTVREVMSCVRQAKHAGDVVVASIHWGGNWGYEIPDEQIQFAHRLIEGGVDIVHGHSSHHVKAMEVYAGHLVLYGCGDFLNDYEGIGGRNAYRSDLAIMYLVKMDPLRRRLAVRLVPMQIRRFRLNRASESDARWLCDLLNIQGKPFRTQVRLEENNDLSFVC